MKLNSVLFAVVLAILPLKALGEACDLSIVEWKDAALHSKQYGFDINHLDDLTVSTQSIGCVVRTEKTVVVIFHFVQGVPDTYLAIPAPWIVKITPLQKKGGPDVVEGKTLRAPSAIP